MRLLTLAAALVGGFFATHAAAQTSLLGDGRYVSIAGGWAGESDYNIEYPPFPAPLTGHFREEVEVESGLVLQAAAGARGGPFRLEAAVSYRDADATSRDFIDPGNTPVPGEDEGSVTATTLDLNVYYDVPTGHALRPYVGVGIGAADVNYEVGGAEEGGDTTVHFQGMVGVSFDVSSRAALFVEGRWERFGDVNVETKLIDPDTNAVVATGQDSYDLSNTAAMAGIRFGF